MKKEMLEIAESVQQWCDETFNDCDVIFTGSLVLKAHGLIDREIGDIDIILFAFDVDETCEKLVNLESLFGSKKHPSAPDHYSIHLPKIGKDLDIFVVDASTDEIPLVFVNEKYFFTTVKHVLNTKMAYNRQKDKHDFQQVLINELF